MHDDGDGFLRKTQRQGQPRKTRHPWARKTARKGSRGFVPSDLDHADGQIHGAHKRAARLNAVDGGDGL